MNRRDFIRTTTAGLAGLRIGSTRAVGEPKRKRQFTLCLACGMIGVPANPRKLIGWASQYGFESIEPPASFLARLSDPELQTYRDEMKARNLAWGSAGVPVDFRGADPAYDQGIGSLPGYAESLQRAGVTRTATWLTPGHKSLTYLANFRLHARRLREIARVLGDHGIRLGLEYVGPKTSWSAHRFPFIHTMAEMKDLIAEIGRDNVGFLLDSWHWYSAQETEADLLALRASDVVMCHVNDAPRDIPVAQQVDSRRELPCATGVIDLRAFLGALIQIGYDGPVACEPFNPALRQMPPDQALRTVGAALQKAAAL
ncbi:MAG TPA: sugar phosphate isomerase/epimerase family protein [Candidatus Paceibacterota bacterium]|nr:sugar phosphate isomerase/epimerase family protein [Verrucomicrobiota bacterium]HRZ46039.1 sugar phosphate isomerase/epimerase family protein [Candidatus Paceibacterota bacterium]HRZ92541.1 sugar phosphate isomerase/epimerase family protein [Candidatus Paceibacterota bacterium]